MDLNTTEIKIKEFLCREFLFDFNEEVNKESNLFQLGLIDSYGFVQLVLYLENEFHINFAQEELVGNSLNTYSNIVTSVERKLNGG